MLIPFSSKASGDFYMMDVHVQALFALMEKPYVKQGIFQANEIPAYLMKLQSALSEADNAKKVTENEEILVSNEEDRELQQTVGLKQRAWPLIEMFNCAEKKNVDVIWGSTI